MDPQRFELYSEGALPPQTLITGNNNKHIVTKKTVNVLLKLLIHNRPITNDDQRSVVNFLKSVSVDKYNGRTYGAVLDLLVRDYTASLKSNQVQYDDYNSYKQKELHHLTHDETGLKFSVYPAMHDTYRDIEKKSQRQQEIAVKEVTQADVNRSMVRMANTVIDMCSPQAMSALYEKMRSFNITYQSTTIPRQTLCFDSRNRDSVASTITNISWNFNYTKSRSTVGNVTLQRPIQEIIRVNIDNPFWLWVIQQNFYIASDLSTTSDSIASKSQTDFFRLTMDIAEFDAQAVTVELPRGLDSLQYQYNVFALSILSIKPGITSRVYVTASSPFTFIKPLAQLDRITIRFYNDYNPIYILPDYYQYSSVVKTTTVISGVSTSKIVISGMVGKTADIYRQILRNMVKDYSGVIRYPADIVTTYNDNTNFYATPIHITNISTGTLELDRLICTSAGWQGKLSFSLSSGVHQKIYGFSNDDSIEINVSNTAIASYPDFTLSSTSPPAIGLYLDAMSFTVNLEFISLEMPAN